ncbi:MAG: dipeptidase PepE [Blastocatellia bacterium]|jgi:dipeptidase E|nr:dipeptidase PepE [Blastocatellia bacterium]
MKNDLLLLSNSQLHGRAILEHAMDAIGDFLGKSRTVLFVPFALADHDGYTAKIGAVLEPLGVEVVGLHTSKRPRAAVESADLIYVGGGNTFRLLAGVQSRRLLEPVRRRVAEGGLKYLGSSAGTNLSCPTIRTTNDMPIVQPRSFEAFGLVPFQINPHYLDPDPSSTHMGETREQRIEQFHEENAVPVLGLREGAWLRRRGGKLLLAGTTGARLFGRGQPAVEFTDGADLSLLLRTKVRFDE